MKLRSLLFVVTIIGLFLGVNIGAFIHYQGWFAADPSNALYASGVGIGLCIVVLGLIFKEAVK
jgi:hypothetical protein